MGVRTTVSLEDIVAARAISSAVAKHTPVLTSPALSEQTGHDIVLKAENLQRTGAFKLRGAMNKVASLGAAAANGVTAGSAGNHALALAFAARHFGVPCSIFVPVGAPITKVEACRAYGAEVVERGASLDEAVAAARAVAVERGLQFCHPFDDPVVVAGQGTLGLELVEDLADLACVVIPLGGGGLASGTAIAVKQQRPDVRVDRRAGRVVRSVRRWGVADRAGGDAGRRHRRQATRPGHRPAGRAVARRRRRRRRGRHRRRHGAADGPGQALRRGRRRGRRRRCPGRRGRPAGARHHVHRAVRRQRRPRRRARA